MEQESRRRRDEEGLSEGKMKEEIRERSTEEGCCRKELQGCRQKPEISEGQGMSLRHQRE